MATTIVTKSGSGAPTASDLVAGELAVDLTNGRLYTEDSGGTVLELGLNPSGNVDVTGTVTADGLTFDGIGANAIIEANTTSDSVGGTAELLKLRAVIGSAQTEVGNIVIQNRGSSENQSLIRFQTANAGTLATRMDIDYNGDISFYEDTGSTPKLVWSSAAEKLTLSGAGGLYVGAGSAGDPSIKMNDVNSGLFAPSGNVVAISAGGGERFRATTAGISVTGSVTTDGLTVDGNTQFNSASAAASGTRSIQFYRDSAERGAVRFDYSASAMELQADGSFFVSTGGEGTSLLIDGSTRDISFYEDTGTTPKFFWDASAESLGIGTSSPTAPLHVFGGGILGANLTNPIAFTGSGGTNAGIGSYTANSDFNVYSAGTGNIKFVTGAVWSSAGVLTTVGSERMRIDASGNLLVGTGSGSTHIIKKAVSVGSVVLEVAGNNLGARFYNADGGTPNAANTAVAVYSVGATGRSVNAAGTVNANGADYAEYERNNGLSISKGSIVGFKEDGTLTLTFSEAIRFAVKSTDPSFVGGDTWGTEAQVGAKPNNPTRIEDESDADFESREAEYETDLATFEEALEAARQLVDRIAYSGKVPVNIQGATAGDYIIAVAADDGSIDGQAVADPDFTQYKLAVGRVNRILDDGRAEIAVIIH